MEGVRLVLEKVLKMYTFAYHKIHK